jgi:hypothetical protein
MPETEPPNGDQQPEPNPYAPPQTDLGPAAAEWETDPDGDLRRTHLRREASIRVAGLFGSILAGLVAITFGLGTLSESFQTSVGEKDLPPWMFWRWVARMICVISIAVIAFATNWGLFRLRNWGRWALAIGTTLPVPALVCGWVLATRTLNPELQESINTGRLTALSIMSALSCSVLLFFLWSPRGETVFSPEYGETIRRTPGARAGCSGILAALVVVSAELFAYTALLMTVLSILAMLEVIRSI